MSLEAGNLLNIGSPWPMPMWLPDETFYSLASRYHAISGNRLHADTNLALFGMRRGGSQHDFPTHLDQFAQRTEGRLGTAATIASARTILPFYLPPRPLTDAVAAVEALTGQPRGMLKYRLGILTSRFRANHPLKACPACMDADAAEHGVAYWHRPHQFPGVWVCHEHGMLLREATLKSTGVQRFGWVLPTAAFLRPIAIAGAISEATIADLSRFAQLVNHWCQLPPGTIEVAALGVAYREAVAARARHGDRRSAADDYCNAIAELRRAPEMAALPATQPEALHQVNRWLFAPQGNTHPLRHLSFIFWLFPDWQSFWSDYTRRSVSLDSAAVAAPATDPRRAVVLERLLAGSSATAAAVAAGVDTGTAIAWAARQGISTSRRPKTLTADKFNALVADLKAGTGKAEAATRQCVSLQSVTRLLRSEVGLQAAWREACISKARDRARSTWHQTLKDFGAEGVAAARRHASAEYAWLYRNDRAWLTASYAGAGSARSRTMPRLDWDSRDALLASGVRRAAVQLAAESGGAQLKLWQLYQLVPELKAKLGALARLPLTRKVISEVTRPRKRRQGDDPLL